MNKPLTNPDLYEYLVQTMAGIATAAEAAFRVLFKTTPSVFHINGINSTILNDLRTLGFKNYRESNSITYEAEQVSSFQIIRAGDRGSSHHLIRSGDMGNIYAHIRYRDTIDKAGDGSTLCDVTFLYDSNTDETKKFIYDIGHKHKPQKKRGAFYMLIKDEYGDLSLRDFTTQVPDNIDLKVNYGINFTKVHNIITKKITDKPAGLYIFHGEPGTGKSTYIKYLASVLPEKKFVYVPEFMIRLLNQPDVIRLFLDNQNIVLVIEDAEKLIQNRESESDGLVGTLLNISDGILSDIMRIPVILTYNTHTDNIDKALLRKGRLQYIHKFDILTSDSIDKLLKQHKVSKEQISKLKAEGKLKDNMSLADIYNVFEDIGGVEFLKPRGKLGFDA